MTLVSPAQWTDRFAFIFKSLVDLLEHNENEQLNAAWKQSSYPDEFIAQLKWLGHMHSAHNSGINAEENIAHVSANQPDSHFPLLYFPKTADGVNQLFNILTPEQCRIACNSLKEKIPQAIKNLRDFCSVFYHLTAEKREVAFDILKERLPEIIHTSRDFKWAFRILIPMPELYDAVYVSLNLKKALPEMVDTIDDFWWMHKWLKYEEFVVVRDKLMSRLPELNINTSYDFNLLFEFLTQELRTKAFEILHKQNIWINIIGNTPDLNRVLTKLTHEQQTRVLISLKETLPEIIMMAEAEDLNCFVKQLDLDQRIAVFHVIEKILPRIVLTPNDLYMMLVGLPFFVCVDVFNRLKNNPQWLHLIYPSPQLFIENISKHPPLFQQTIKRFLLPTLESMEREAKRAADQTELKVSSSRQSQPAFFSSIEAAHEQKSPHFPPMLPEEKHKSSTFKDSILKDIEEEMDELAWDESNLGLRKYQFWRDLSAKFNLLDLNNWSDIDNFRSNFITPAYEKTHIVNSKRTWYGFLSSETASLRLVKKIDSFIQKNAMQTDMGETMKRIRRENMG